MLQRPSISLSCLLIVVIIGALSAAEVGAQSARGSSEGELIAFIRNGDIWLMNPDGSSQRPWVSGIGNAKGRMSWSPDNKRLAFSRQGKATINYPEGGGGYHSLYDCFYAYIDSIGKHDNFWMSFTNSLGSQGPDWAAKAPLICFSHDLMGNTVDASMPNYAIGLFHVETKELRVFELPKDSMMLMALMPALSPDGGKICFVLGGAKKSQMDRLGMLIIPADKINMTSAQLVEAASKMPDASSPAWSPDGKLIAYMQNDGIYVANVDLTGARKICSPGEGLWVTGFPTWSPDSKKLAFATSNGSIYTVNLDGTGLKRISGPGNDANPAWTR